VLWDLIENLIARAVVDPAIDLRFCSEELEQPISDSPGRLLLVVAFKDRQIDPDRTNINVPNTIQRVMSVGAETPWVTTILFTADGFFGNSGEGY
jgi:hypothetical protein